MRSHYKRVAPITLIKNNCITKNNCIISEKYKIDFIILSTSTKEHDLIEGSKDS